MSVIIYVCIQEYRYTSNGSDCIQNIAEILHTQLKIFSVISPRN